MLIGSYPPKASPARQRGFTLIEVILVLVIVAMLSVFILSRNTPIAAQAKLQGEVELLKTQLRYAQARSLNANDVWGMAVNTSNHLWLFTGGDLNSRVKLPGESGDFVDYANDPRKSGLTLGGVGATPPISFLVSFDDRGRPHTNADATDPAAAPIVMTVTDGSTTEQIDIAPNTGFIE